MKYQAVKSFYAHENEHEERADFASLSDALAYIRDTSEGHIWARKEVIVNERVGFVVAQLSSHEAEGLTEDQARIELEEEFRPMSKS